MKYLKTGSAYYAPSAATVEMVESILKDKKKVLPCAALLDGRIWLQRAVRGRSGEARLQRYREDLRVKLAAEEKAQLDKSAAAVKELIDVLKQKTGALSQNTFSLLEGMNLTEDTIKLISVVLAVVIVLAHHPAPEDRRRRPTRKTTFRRGPFDRHAPVPASALRLRFPHQHARPCPLTTDPRSTRGIPSSGCASTTRRIHRWGVYAEKLIPKGRKVIEYTGERINRHETKRRAEGELQLSVLRWTRIGRWTAPSAAAAPSSSTIPAIPTAARYHLQTPYPLHDLARHSARRRTDRSTTGSSPTSRRSPACAALLSAAAVPSTSREKKAAERQPRVPLDPEQPVVLRQPLATV